MALIKQQLEDPLTQVVFRLQSSIVSLMRTWSNLVTLVFALIGYWPLLPKNLIELLVRL